MSAFGLKSFPDEAVSESMLLPFQCFSLHFEKIKVFLKKNLITLYVDNIWENPKRVSDMK